jgi:RNA polymerase sigma-70 factor (ECF subfamily)
MTAATDRMNREFLAYRRDLRAFLMMLDRDPVLVEDILQETWVLLAEQGAKGVVVGQVDAWCRTTARRAWIRHRRASRRERPDDDLVAERIERAFAAEPVPAEPWEGQVEALRACLDGIDPATRRLLERRYLESVETRTLAEEFGASEATLMVRLSRLRARLRECVESRLRTMVPHGG